MSDDIDISDYNSVRTGASENSSAGMKEIVLL